jgi:hypothetical protein
MVRRFQVAGLTFSLSLPDAFPAADLLHNYDPFDIDLRTNSQPPETSFGPHRCASLAVPPLTKPRVARFPEAAVGSAPSFADVIGESLFKLKITDRKPGEPGERLLRSEERTGEPVVGFYRSGEGYLAEFAPTASAPVCGVLEMSGDFREGSLYTTGSPANQAFAVNNALMLLFAFAAAPFAALEMHASVVTHGGRGFLFLGKSGTGKSTHSRLWLENISGTELLNDDNPVLRVVDGVARVFGSPWSGKTPCYKAQDVPVGAIVRLSQAPQNRIERLPTVQAYASVMASCSGFRPIRSLADAQHETLSQIAQQVPCYHLECLPDAAAARLCQETVDG